MGNFISLLRETIPVGSYTGFQAVKDRIQVIINKALLYTDSKKEKKAKSTSDQPKKKPNKPHKKYTTEKAKATKKTTHTKILSFKFKNNVYSCAVFTLCVN